MLTEAALIAPFHAAYPEYVGDDAAVLPESGGRCLLMTTDMLTESVHFRLTYFSPDALANKVLQVNLSDIAAMGGEPQYVLLSVGIPLAHTGYMHAFHQAFIAHCQRLGITIVGGDTVRAAALTINLTVVGHAKQAHIKYRSGARPGDRIYIAGDLGRARVGLHALEAPCPDLLSWAPYLLSPIARLKEGQWLAQQTAVTSMMDVSDGLAQDLLRLCRASGVRGSIDWSQCAPLLDTHDMQAAACIMRTSVPALVFSGGEDYSLLFTVSPEGADALAAAFHRAQGYPLCCLGHITAGEGVQVQHAGAPFSEIDAASLKDLGAFLHFGSAEIA